MVELSRKTTCLTSIACAMSDVNLMRYGTIDPNPDVAMNRVQAENNVSPDPNDRLDHLGVVFDNK